MNGKVKVGVNCVECYEVVDVGWFEPATVAVIGPMWEHVACGRCMARIVNADVQEVAAK